MPPEISSEDIAKQRAIASNMGVLMGMQEFHWYLENIVGRYIADQQEKALDDNSTDEEANRCRKLRTILLELKNVSVMSHITAQEFLSRHQQTTQPQ